MMELPLMARMVITSEYGSCSHNIASRLCRADHAIVKKQMTRTVKLLKIS